jgi:hypothetical protein
MNEAKQKTVGQVAYEEYTRALFPGATYPPQTWEDLEAWERDGWEAVARAVQSFYETGIPGAR